MAMLGLTAASMIYDYLSSGPTVRESVRAMTNARRQAAREMDLQNPEGRFNTTINKNIKNLEKQQQLSDSLKKYNTAQTMLKEAQQAQQLRQAAPKAVRKAAPKFFASGSGATEAIAYIQQYYGVPMREAKNIYKTHFLNI
jgi:histidinol-phosphate/aromatic aminotransferase/cobyric acid decarboxylase-like protein